MENGGRPGNNWEELRRQARQIENEIDSKLLAFAKLSSKDLTYESSTTSESASLLGSTSDSFERVGSEIEALLNQLSDINNRMSQYSQQMQNASAVCTQQRHREILSDYTNEFRKTRENIEAQLAREQLLGSVKKDISDFKSASGASRKSELYAKENEHVRNSEIMIDEQITVAMRTRDTLFSQRNAVKSIQTQMTNLANRFPMINSLIGRINVRRRKDSIVIGCVIAVCMTFLLIYIF